jgi:NADH-quinone oxidoreductase subunit J
MPGDDRVWRDAVYRAPTIDPGDVEPNARGIVINDMPRSLGNDLMTRWVIPFEVAGLLLTAALVGAVALARSEVLDEHESARRGGVRPTNATAPPTNGEPAKPAVLSHTP